MLGTDECIGPDGADNIGDSHGCPDVAFDGESYALMKPRPRPSQHLRTVLQYQAPRLALIETLESGSLLSPGPKSKGPTSLDSYGAIEALSELSKPVYSSTHLLKQQVGMAVVLIVKENYRSM